MKKLRNSTFFINENMELTIYKSNFNKKIHCCSEGTIALEYGQEMIIIGLDNLNCMFKRFEFMFNQALHKKLLIDSSMIIDPGIVENQYYHAVHKEEKYDIDSFRIEKDARGLPYWIGHNYMLCGFRHRQTWLYNDKYGNIILEVTPSYHSLIKRRKKKMSFTRWMDTKYKPILKRIIKKEVAEEWVILAKNMLSMIQKNKEKEASIKK